MGMTDADRWTAVVGAVNELATAPRFSGYGYRDLRAPIDALWPAMVACEPRFGGGSHLAERSLLRAAFDRVRVAVADPPVDMGDRSPSAWRGRSRVGDVVTLLDGEDRRAMEAIHLVDAAVVAADYYPGDDFSRTLAPVVSALATLRGALHNFTATRPIFAVAWMMSVVLDRCIPWSDTDAVTVAAAEFCWNHHLRADGQDFATVHAMLLRHQNTDRPAKDRLDTVLRLVGAKFHYAHQHRQLLEIVREHNARTHLRADLEAQGLTPEEAADEARTGRVGLRDWIDEARVWRRCLEAARAAEAEPARWRPFCHFTGRGAR